MSETRNVKFWTCNADDEVLYATDIDEAVAMWAEGRPNLPETVTVYGFAEMELPPAKHHADRQLEDLLEWLDEEYGDPSASGESQRTEAMSAAATGGRMTAITTRAVGSLPLSRGERR